MKVSLLSIFALLFLFQGCYSVTQNDSEAELEVDSNGTVHTDTFKYRRVEKEILEDTIIYFIYENEVLLEKKILYPDNSTTIMEYRNGKQDGAVISHGSDKKLRNVQYWVEGVRKFNCDYGISGEITNFEGNTFLETRDYSKGLKVGDTLWINIDVIPVPNTIYRSCSRPHKDSSFYCYNKVINQLGMPIVDYYICDKSGPLTRNYLITLIDTISSRELSGFRFTVETIVSE